MSDGTRPTAWEISARATEAAEARARDLSRIRAAKQHGDEADDEATWADDALDDVEAVFAEHEAAAAFARDVEIAAWHIRVRDGARRKVAAEGSGNTERPRVVPLREFLAVNDPPVTYRVSRLWTTGGRVVLVAQWKAGKTTAIGNLIRSLADGDPFLDTFHTTPANSIVLIDDELDEGMLRGWLRAQHVVNVDAVRLVSLRGRVASFDLLDPKTRRQWAADLAGADVVILDCLRPVLDALALDESRDAGRFLVPFDALLREVGGGDQAADGLIVHHMGHHGERSRGDSRILDWPDASWKLVREDPDDPASPRYLSAFGRDVDVPEGRLHYTEQTRRLTFAGGNRRESAADGLVPTVLELLAANPAGLSGRAVEAALTPAGHGRNEVRQALARSVKTGAAQARPGPSNSILHTLSAPVRHSAPVDTGAPVSECASAPIGAHGAHTAHADRASAPPGALDDCTICGLRLPPISIDAGDTTHVSCAEGLGTTGPTDISGTTPTAADPDALPGMPDAPEASTRTTCPDCDWPVDSHGHAERCEQVTS